MKQTQRQPTDELCQCGHLRSEHLALPDVPPPYGEGKGLCPKCSCQRFTWKEFVFAENPDA